MKIKTLEICRKTWLDYGVHKSWQQIRQSDGMLSLERWVSVARPHKIMIDKCTSNLPTRIQEAHIHEPNFQFANPQKQDTLIVAKTP